MCFSSKKFRGTYMTMNPSPHSTVMDSTGDVCDVEERKVKVGADIVEVKAVVSVDWVMEVVNSGVEEVVVDGVVVNSVDLLGHSSTVDEVTVALMPCITDMESVDVDDDDDVVLIMVGMDVVMVVVVRELVLNNVEITIVDGLGVFGEEVEVVTLLAGNG